MTRTAAPPSVRVAGWTITLIDTGAIWAPITWVDPNADGDTFDWFPSGALVCRRGADVLLVDCGFGPFREQFPFDVDPVDLADALASAGVSVQGVTTVFLTHLDSDHVGGLVEPDGAGGLRPAFGGTPVRMLDASLAILDGVAEERREPEATIGAAMREAAVDVQGLPGEPSCSKASAFARRRVTAKATPASSSRVAVSGSRFSPT